MSCGRKQGYLSFTETNHSLSEDCWLSPRISVFSENSQQKCAQVCRSWSDLCSSPLPTPSVCLRWHLQGRAERVPDSWACWGWILWGGGACDTNQDWNHHPGYKVIIIYSWSTAFFCTSNYGYRFVCCPFNCLQDPECAGREGPKDQRVDRCGPEEVWLPRGQRWGKCFGMNWDCIVYFIDYLTNVPCVSPLMSAVRWEGCHSWSLCHCPGRVLALQVAGRPGCA